MLSKMSKRCFGGLICLFAIVLSMPFSVLAASSGTHYPLKIDENNLGGVEAVVSNASDNSMSNGEITVTSQGTDGWFIFPGSSKTTEITIKNISGAAATIYFNWAATGVNKLEIDGSTVSGTGNTFSKFLNNNESVSVVITTGRNSNVNKLVLSKFVVEAAAASSKVVFEYDDALGSITVNGSKVSSGAEENVSLESGAVLVATPISGVSFLGWIDNSTGAVLSKDTTYTLVPAADITVKAMFMGSGSTPYFMLGGAIDDSYKDGLLGTTISYKTVPTATHYFDDLNKAAEAAAAGTSKYIVLLNNAILPAGTYTIPVGVTLLIPFDATNSLYTTQAVSTSSYTSPTAYRTLTMADGANLVVDGAMSLSAKLKYAAGGSPAGGLPSGGVSFVQMQGKSSISVNGALYAYGYITGSGSVTANSGASIYEAFQFMDFRGGSQSTGMKNGVFPLSQYYVQNIEVPLTINAGATEYAFTNMYMSSACFGTSVKFIGESSMFNLEDGYATKHYDGTTDRLIIELYGKASLTNVKLDFGFSGIDSKDYDLPLNHNITVKLMSGSASVSQDIAMLPGAEIVISEGTSCTVKKDINVYVYDSDEWNGNFYHKGSSQPTNFIAAPYAPGRSYTRTQADNLVDAKIQIDGVVNATEGFIYTTDGGANIYSTKSGMISITPGTQSVTHQCVQSSTTTYTEIPLTPAQLKNADGSYVQTSKGNAGESTTYTYSNGKWVHDVAKCFNNAGVEQGIYTTVKEAAEKCPEKGYVQMISFSEEPGFNLTADLYLDLSGKTLELTNSGITASSGKYLYGMDRSSDGYGLPTGGIIGTVTASATKPASYKFGTTTNKHYLAITADEKTTFHRVAVSLTRYALVYENSTPNLIVEGTFRGTTSAYGKLADMGFLFDPNIATDTNSAWLGRKPAETTTGSGSTTVQFSFTATDGVDYQVTPQMKLLTIALDSSNNPVYQTISGSTRTVSINAVLEKLKEAEVGTQ